MKQFSLPVGVDFVAGLLDRNSMLPTDGEPDRPPYGVIVWYADQDTAKAAVKAACEAHWTEV